MAVWAVVGRCPHGYGHLAHLERLGSLKVYQRGFMAHTQPDWKHTYITVIECYFYNEGYVCIWIITQCASNLIRWEWFVSHCQLCSVPTWYLFEPVKGLVWDGCPTAYERDTCIITTKSSSWSALSKSLQFSLRFSAFQCPHKTQLPSKPSFVSAPGQDEK